MIEAMGPPVWHLTESDAVRDMASILQRVQAGTEAVIERDEPWPEVRSRYALQPWPLPQLSTMHE